VSKFFSRERELAELDAVVAQRDAQFILVYGRRRVGKTTLLLHWAQRTGRPYIYWVARRDTPDIVRQSFARALWRWAYPEGERTEPSRVDDWELLFELMAEKIGDQPVILIFDEFSYAVGSDPSLSSHLQALWDHRLKEKPVTLILAGSHIGTMVDLMAYHAALYGRFTAQLPVDPLPFSALADFLPRYSVAQRVAIYAVAGGIPAYLERFDDGESVGANIRRLFMRRTGMFRSEPFVLIGDVIRRDTQTYEAVLGAVAAGRRTPKEIGSVVGFPSTHLSPYLKQLRDLRLIERRLPATIPREKRRSSRSGRYHLADPYLRFYFRFIAPNLDLVEQELDGLLWERIAAQFRAFVGATAFEDLCREWTLVQARAGKLPFAPEIVGEHWSPEGQIDVVAVNWQEKAILLGECKWGTGAMGRGVVRDLVSKSSYLLPGRDWKRHLVFFARAGFTDAARAEAEALRAQLVDLQKLDDDLRAGLV
jgi:AAA+ ATPase superfamily predicted ATPase